MKIKFQRNTALKFLQKQPLKQRERIDRALRKLPEGDVLPFEGREGVFRLRVGDYRVVFRMDLEHDAILVLNVGNRGDVYKKF